MEKLITCGVWNFGIWSLFFVYPILILVILSLPCISVVYPMFFVHYILILVILCLTYTYPLCLSYFNLRYPSLSYV